MNQDLPDHLFIICTVIIAIQIWNYFYRCI